MTEQERPDPHVQRCTFCGQLIGDAAWVPDGFSVFEGDPDPIAHGDCAWPDLEDGRTPDE
jgi:hypothetical protein